MFCTIACWCPGSFSSSIVAFKRCVFLYLECSCSASFKIIFATSVNERMNLRWNGWPYMGAGKSPLNEWGDSV